MAIGQYLRDLLYAEEVFTIFSPFWKHAVLVTVLLCAVEIPCALWKNGRLWWMPAMFAIVLSATSQAYAEGFYLETGRLPDGIGLPPYWSLLACFLAVAEERAVIYLYGRWKEKKEAG